MTAVAMSSAIFVISSVPIPCVVVHGVPTRMPEAMLAFCGSNGIAFLLRTIPAASARASASTPVTPTPWRSCSDRCVSVPPVVGRMPCSPSEVASCRAFSTTRRAYSAYSGVAHSLKFTALAAMVCICGPPCIIGKTARSSAAACSALDTRAPERGPRSTLCVVNVTTSAYGTGLGIALPATRPMKCAASTQKIAPTSSARLRKNSKSMSRGIALPPARITLGRCSRASSATWS